VGRLRAVLTDPSFIRYLVTGGIVVVVYYGLLILLHGVLQWIVTVAAVTAFLGAFVVNFSLNRNWTFRADGAPTGQLVRFTALVAVNTVVTGLGMGWMVGLGLPYLVAKTILVVAIVAVNYWVMRRWVFALPALPAAEEPPGRP
jgi:putative flippase GtrA